MLKRPKFSFSSKNTSNNSPRLQLTDKVYSFIFDTLYSHPRIKNFYKRFNDQKDVFWFFCFCFALGTTLFLLQVKNEAKKLNSNQLRELIERQKIRKVVIMKKHVNDIIYHYEAQIVLSDGSTKFFNVNNLTFFINEMNKLGIPVINKNYHLNFYHYYYQLANFISKFDLILIGLLLVSFYNLVMRNRFGPSKIKRIQPGDIKVKFSDFAGMDEVKKEITEFVDFLSHSEKYSKLGAKIPRGALLVGPPGTGKTFLVKACAAEANVPFFYLSGSEFVSGYVGMGAKTVSKLFDTARKHSPSIIFVDELDAIGNKRESQFGNPEADNTLN